MCYLYWFVGCSVQCNMVCGGRVPMGMRYWGFPVLVSALRLFFTSHWWFLFIIISILIRIWERLCEYDMARTHIAYGMMPAGMFIVGRDVALWNGDLSSSLFICHNHNNNTFVPKHINSTSPSDNYLSGASIIFSHTHISGREVFCKASITTMAVGKWGQQQWSVFQRICKSSG